MLEQQSEDVDDALRLAHESIQKAMYEGKNERARAVLAMLKEGQDPSVQCKFPLQNATSEVVRMAPLVVAARFVGFLFFSFLLGNRKELWHSGGQTALFGAHNSFLLSPVHRMFMFFIQIQEPANAQGGRRLRPRRKQPKRGHCRGCEARAPRHR
jgi:hypothetical protein